MQSEATYYKMTSRKRNKGKERKAKKFEAEQVAKRVKARTTWQYWARGEMGLNVGGNCIIQSIECNHGCNVTIPDENNHPVCGFMDLYFMHCLGNSNKNMSNVNFLIELFNSYPQVWKHDNYREMAIDILVRIGANKLLVRDPNLDAILHLATSILALENYDEGGYYNSPNALFHNRTVSSKVRDFVCGSRGIKNRDVLKFFRKRITCSCLKKMHLEVRKTQPKLGKCSHCEVVKERALLMVCSRCRILQYCSRECQVADWAEHKGYCKECVSVHKQQQSKKR